MADRCRVCGLTAADHLEVPTIACARFEGAPNLDPSPLAGAGSGAEPRDEPPAPLQSPCAPLWRHGPIYGLVALVLRLAWMLAVVAILVGLWHLIAGEVRWHAERDLPVPAALWWSLIVPAAFAVMAWASDIRSE